MAKLLGLPAHWLYKQGHVGGTVEDSVILLATGHKAAPHRGDAAFVLRNWPAWEGVAHWLADSLVAHTQM